MAAAHTTLEVVEPTLVDATGHCYSFLESLCRAADGQPITVWGGTDAVVSFPENVALRRYFRRRVRRLQAWWLYRKLLRQPGRLFISSGGRTDLILLDLAAGGSIPPGKAVMYVHWFRASPARARQLARLAGRQPEIRILAPTESVCAAFRAAGFRQIELVPYPVAPADASSAPPDAEAFRHLLFAGAARPDKGFSEMVNLVEMLSGAGQSLPIVIQTSAQHYEKTHPSVIADRARLQASGYPFLTRVDRTLDPVEYRDLFRGAICLQLYSRSDFADRISGVTLDALTLGSPIVALSRTWVARLVEEFGAGVVVEDAAPQVLLDAARRIIASYGEYRRRALEAGHAVQIRHRADQLYQAVVS